MIPALITKQTLKNVTNRIPTFLFRNKSSQAHVLPEEPTESLDPDLPTLSESPYKKEKTLCILCKHNIEPDYKNVRLLSQFQSRHTGRIYGKHITGLCEHKQKRVEQEMIKAQHAGLMGYMTKDVKFVDDPKLFNPNFPFRKHRW
ncbi:28S ribosomal protein S18c, mitochondrial isoform X2 [Osmia bicornis bicornis]|uniref:28S ribosomal protein S18c, mitochondrial isoform X1 n=1 Tax=Osmia bicornis bicornis TaxID=1437191 RepID=UPI0010F7CE73|nr:28S ribosomal protein S18c, mitochondrial isoform X1 [Osmia bicornis bicornis]XP_029036736.1 28S ribosomal protein S18c, mitochondrial isoform X2 [Osmia bicornis bicornis]